MSVKKVSLGAWRSAAEEATREIATAALGLDCTVVDHAESPPSGLSGAYIALISAEDSVQIGMAADAEGCQKLSRALLGIEDGADALPPSDVADAIGEILNMVAGGIKKRVNAEVPALTIGLPLFLHGRVEPTDKQETSVSNMRIGDINAAFLLIGYREKQKVS